MCIAASIIIGSLLAASTCTTWWSFFFFFAVTFPLGGGVGYWVPIMCSWEWYPNKRATASGVTQAGFGMGPFIFSFITTAIVNPDNIKSIAGG